MARLSTSSTIAASGHATASASTEGTPATQAQEASTTPIKHKDEDDYEGPTFDWDLLKRRYSSMMAPVPFDVTLLPKGSRSLTAISSQAFGCGFMLAASLLLIHKLALEKHDTIWRLPAFFSCLAFFHFLEFYITARYNIPATRANSFLLNNGVAYNVAHTCAALEIIASRYFLPSWYGQLFVWTPYTIVLAMGMIVVGQIVRSVAMAQAGTNFNHTPVQKREEGHVLVTHGMYRFSRHPSYFGFFWWTLGTQVLVGNKVCFLGYAYVLWTFFSRRIRAEERTLIQFFGDDYRAYKKRVGTLIPFVK
ncbi:farnesyl cysteine-carboxyl methyltransferase [Recurvomyces mirabilis]|uniref:Protein-S-isoprenylcysteine O-methyltransferase n=1 Tax=Recurvomyces mirabilis TaxID=574656 RepID=A0AAE0WQJ3_9PEZI|nr:farnesyl cysteine-carboxyl methyltransferase [Recurvomyces mirabilis]KAK5153952.1 farnesyl cysteine-carboxyl methyltransferase [Recurvomyces mirabilis]